MFVRFFIDRPIAAAVLSILVTLGGVVGLARLPVALYPEITPPTVEVSAVYPGANARDVEATVAAPVEQQVNGVEGMMYMSSTSCNDGSYTLTITFEPRIDLNIAQVLVQNRVNLAERVLPDIVRRRGISVKKKSTGQLLIINLYSPDASRPDVYLSNYATIQLRDELARLEGVGDIQYLGQRDYSMRVWLDPEKLAGRGLTAEMAVHAIEEQNAQVAAGQIGQPPVETGQAFQYTINTRGRLSDPREFEDIILKTDPDGRAVRLRDVSTHVELGSVSYDQTCTFDGRPSIALSVYQLPGTNALQTAARVKEKMAELRTRFPTDVEYAIAYDTTPFIDESVSEVFVTLRDAVILVAIVMLVFLQNWRSAIIPLAAVPVAIVGTFGAMAGFGYSLNALTLFGLVLAVGIVVDDAIVVVEAVEQHLEKGESPRDATINAMNEVAGPVIAVALVLSAVFVPCLFISGIVGQFFRQFAVTIAISTLLSALNSLTLSPALCALLLRRHEGRVREPLPRVVFPLAFAAGFYYLARMYSADLAPAKQWLDGQVGPVAAGVLVPVIAALLGVLLGYLLRVVLNKTLGAAFYAFNWAFERVTTGYLAVVKLLLFVTPLALVGYAGLMYLTGVVLVGSPVGFIPAQDKGYLLVNLQLPDSASLSRSDAAVRLVDAEARKIEGVQHTVAVAGQSLTLGANAANFGTVYVLFEPFSERLGAGRSAEEIRAKLQSLCEEAVPDAVVRVLNAPPIEGLGATGGAKLMVECRAEPDAKQLQETAERLVESARARPELANPYTGFRADTPWLELRFDREQAEATGVSVTDVLQDLQVQLGSYYVNDFNRFGRTWQVNVQADAKFRNDLSDFQRLKVSTRTGQTVPLAGFVSVRDTTGPAVVTRYNLYPSAAVTIDPAAGTSSGTALETVEQLADAELPQGLRWQWTELALLQRQSGNTALYALVLSVVLVFLVLAAQYESWALPLAVILVVPMCLLGAGLGVRAMGQDINIFTQVGFVVLIGLACKNAILIVEYARARHQAGLTRRAATLEACRLRLRPIVMTSVAFILGVVPLLTATGAGAEMRRLLGTAVFSGMLGVTLFGVFLTPVFFLAIQWAVDLARGDRDGEAHLPPQSAPAPEAGGEVVLVAAAH